MNHIINSHHLLKDNQFYHKEYDKKRVCLHHTSGGSLKSSIDWWNLKPDHVSTPYIIDRDGSIHELFNPKQWAYALGVNSSWQEKKTIHIELCNWGWLNEINGKFYNWAGREYNGNVTTFKELHRGHFHYESYTSEQIDSLIYLLNEISWKYDIGFVNTDIEKFWHYDYTSRKTLISHTTLRKDKSDIHPQPELIEAIYDYANCKAEITE